MKKTIAMLLAVCMVFLMTACTKEKTIPPAVQNPDYAPEELMTLVLDKLSLPFYVDSASVELDADNSLYYVGVTESLNLLETEAAAAESANVIPFWAVIVKVKDVKDVQTVKAEMLNGMRQDRWPHVPVSRMLVIDSGTYILLALGRNCDSVVSAFKSILPEKCGEYLERELKTSVFYARWFFFAWV